MQFKLNSSYQPAGDQPEAINALVSSLQNGNENNILLGVTGSGKTYTIANVIEKIQKPTLIISHNKTLAAQLYQEFRDFFPDNAVSYFVSYYDYYQPEAYIPTTDTYIEKETQINEEIDKLRLLATANLQTRNDVIVIASVSCIYNIGNPQEYANFTFSIEAGQIYPRQTLLRDLTKLQYQRNDYELKRGGFRVKGDVVELWPAYTDQVLRMEFLGNVLEKAYWLDPLTSQKIEEINDKYFLFPAKHYIADPARQQPAFVQIRQDLKKQLELFQTQGKKMEAFRLEQRVNYDLDMIAELGYVNGIENYSRYFDGRNPGDPPYSLLEYFRQKKDWLLVVDESHITLPQIRGMYNCDQARKRTLIDYGFRLPSALDNRPLQFNEFLQKIGKTIYLSATPADWELNLPQVQVIEQIVRPTGLIDPDIEIRPTQNQVQDLAKEIMQRKAKGQRVLVTTLTKRLAEALTDYLNEEKNFANVETGRDLSLQIKPKVAYLHSDIDTLDRQDILDDLRAGEYDVLVGINLLREGLDLPEVSLVAILDADKEGFLRSRNSLIQIMGRAARHVEGHVIMYADQKTKSMQQAIEEVERRRALQKAYNEKNGIEPQSIQKEIRKKLIENRQKDGEKKTTLQLTPRGKEVAIEQIKVENYTPDDLKTLVKRLKKAMFAAARELDFEKAARIRDKVREIENF
ncbi:excinuclease ABC subunit UvrB [Candidatus Beckwithbacteria bacterium]|nr:excinuclease ABC subunit UvrB [Candidatus Beckwithbacteria bacterium]